MEDEERRRKIEAGRAKLAQFRQRRARLDGQNPHKKPKKKKTSSSKNDVHGLNIDQSKSEETFINSSQGVGSAVMPESTIMRTLNNEEMLKHEQVFCVDPESEISTTADDYSSEVNDCCNVVKTGKPTNLLMEEEFGVVDSYSEQGAHYSETHLELIENELVGKPEHEPEELNRELDEMRATYETEGLHQLQEFEAAVKQRDGIITQLTANLQQARRERDETVREFLKLTEQSQKLQIQFQQLQASETLQNSTHSNTAADLLQAKQQILTHQQQLEEQDHLLEDYQKKKEDFKMQINFLQEKIKVYEMEQDEIEKSNKKELQEKEAIIQALNIRIIEEEKKNLELKDQVTATEKLMRELQEQFASMKLELANSKQKERQCSEEIKQLMGTVEDLQKRHHYTDCQFESDVIERMVEQEMQKRLEQLRAEMDEMYGQQIVQMKQELIKQHMSQIEELKAQHKEEIESVLKSHLNITINEDQIKLMNVAINELNMKLQDTNAQKEKLQEELGIVSGEKSTLQRQLDDLFEELNFLRDQIQRARMIIAEQESQLNEAHKSLSTVEALKAEIVLASESRKELELKHEAEVTNYKIKLEMLEKEKNAVLDRMAESQEAELERLRTQLLFSHEEELSKLKEDLEVEHRINIEKLKDSLGIHYKQQINGLQNEMSQKIEIMQFEKDYLITKRNQLVLEISKLKDLQKSIMDSKSEEMTLQMHELQEEIEILRQEKKEKGTLEQEVQELQLKIELLEKQIKEKEDDLKEKFSQLEAENNILKNEKKAIEDMLKIYVPAEQEEKLIFIDSSKSISKDCSWQKEMEMLAKENEALKQQCIQLNEEIEKQRSTFSFAEKNFEVNYQELQEEYTCLLKVKDDLEDSKNKQELEYKSKLKALNEELHLQRINPATIKLKSAMLDTDKAFVAEPLEICEVVEKDTTELMEKLEVTKREKLELSEKLSDLSEQLKQKHGEVNFLSEEVKSLKQEKEKILLRCQELELLINHHRAENINMCDVHLSSLQDGIVTIISKDSQGSLSNVGEDFGEESKTVVEEKFSFENVAIRRESKQEQLFSPSVTNESSPGTDQSSENDKLYQELYVLKSEQNDLRLQMEAQRICLSLVYSAHVDQVRENENEKDKALCSLKEELISTQEEKIKELQKIYQLELQNVKTQETDTKKIKQLEEQIQELENFICFLRQQLKETEENHRAEIYSLQEKLQAISEATVDPSFSVDSVVIKESDVQKSVVHPGSCLKKNIDHSIEFSNECGMKQETNMVKLLEKQYQERLEEEIAKDQIDLQTSDALDMKFKEEFKPLSKELGKDGEVLLPNSDHLDDIVESEVHQLTISEEMFSKDKTFIVSESIHGKMLASSMDASRQMMSNEEQLEDTRQELVRQYEEHQQATELLRQAHMRHMERQREEQEQLQEEIKRLNRQLAQRSSLNNENLVSERERVLLEELEALKQLSLAGREKLCCELRSSSTQTQNENENQREIEEQTLKEKEMDRRPEDVPPDSLSSERFALQKTNNRLLKILLEVVKTTIAVEETIGRHVLGILDRSSKGQSSVSLIWRSESEASVKSTIQEEHIRVIDRSIPPYSGSDMPRTDNSMCFKVTEEGTELSQHLIRIGFARTEIDPENEELMLNISSRLQAAVEKILEALSETSSQENNWFCLESLLITTDKFDTESSFIAQHITHLCFHSFILQGFTYSRMDSYRTYLATVKLDGSWLEEQDEDIYEVESRVPLPYPFPLCEHLDENNSVIINTSIFHLIHKRNGHILKLISKISLPTPPYSVEQLTNNLKEKTDKCSELLLSKEQLQRDVQERNEEIEKLEFRVRELEQALLVSTDNFQKVEDQKQFGALEAKAELSLEVQLQAERDAIYRKEKEITNLEEQLEQFRDELENKNEEVQQLHMQLEIQKKESTTRLQELEQENKLFKDEMEKLRFAMKDPEAISTHDQHMLFGKFAQIIQEKEVEIDRLNEQIRDFHQQLRLTTDNKDFEEKNELIRDLEAQIECLKSDQERLKKNREEETDKLNEVIEKLQEELSYIEQSMLVDTSSPSEQEDSLKHQLEKVIAEKLALEQQVEITNEEMAFTKNVLKETNFKMDQLTQELVNLKREHDPKDKIQSIPDESVSMTIDDISKDQPELEVIHIEDVLKPPENNMYLRSFEESTKVSKNLETKLLQLESSVSAKDLELTQCYKQIEDIKEQGQSETEMLQKKIVNLQKVLEEKVAAALTSQVQLEAVQEYVKFCQDKGVASSELEKENMQNLNQITENKMESDMSALTLRISDLERQVIEMHTTLISEKEQVETAEKNALEKEKKLIELQKLLEDSKKKLEGKERKRSPHGDFVLKTTTELINASGESGFFEELEALRIELVATKEELVTFKERTEKLQKELLVKETNMASLQRDLSQVKNQLDEEKKKLSHFLLKEDKSEVPINRNICLEPLPIEVGKNTASQTDQILKVNMSNQTPQILVKNAGIQIDVQTSCSSEKVFEIIRQFTERIEHIQELHAAEILDMESRHISETETLKKEHYVAVELLTEECGTLKAVIQCLRPKEGSLMPELTYSNAYQTREIYSSDSGSDWSQGVYLTQNQGFDTASEGRGKEGENLTESFPKKIKGLLRALHNEGMQVLSLTESPSGDGEDHSIQQVSEFWLEERRAYLNIISSLKDLITKIQVQRESEVYDNSQSQESLPDWRGEFLLALQHVFLKERNVLLATFQTELTALGTKDAVGLLKCLEQRIQEQGIEYQAAMEYLQKIDRRSLLSEIEVLRAQINDKKMTLKREQENDKPNLELLEYTMQQKQSQILEMQVELSNMKDKASELQEHLVVAELKNELAQTELELETTLKAQHKHLKELEAFRMKILVQRWQQVTDSGSTNVNRDGFELNPELDGEPRPTTYRSRSDLDSPRCLLPFQNRSPGTLADLNPGSTVCSHLQNYDPDRALADYITWLEALQRRLGTVQTGSTTTFHSGMRR
ncbi:A-kinase anchor protein 9-like [Urocitellus parryii]